MSDPAPDLMNVPDHGVTCLLCGGRGGWWSGEFREQCQRCEQTGWEPSPILRATLSEASDD